MRLFWKSFFVVALFALFSVPFGQVLHAQTFDHTLWITWRATTYLPKGYTGRAMPIPDTKIIAALDLIQNGRTADLSKQTVYWYVNDVLLTGGQGLTRVSVPVPNSIGGGAFSLRAALPDYEGGIAKTITVPVSSPLAIIPPIAPENAVRSSSFLARVIPYFFDIADPDELNVSWKINGKAPQSYSDPFALKISLDPATPAQSLINLDARIENPGKIIEFATRRSSILFKP